jgi:AcrR family transcriptional regulator
MNPPNPPPETTRSRVIESAIACFRRYGPGGTSMQTIASQAALGRQTVYRCFSTRSALLDAIALQRLIMMRDRMRARVNSYATFDAALSEGTLAVRTIARRDTVFMMVVEASGDRGLERYLLRPSAVVRDTMEFIWRDVFERARARHELRADLSNMEIADWLRIVNFTLLLRDDLSNAARKKLIRTFVLPALTRQR